MTTKARDAAFFEAFVAGDVDRLERLALEGATTAAFPDDELASRANFASTVCHVLQHGHLDIERFVRGAGLVMQRGPAFLTNRAYVGNGGAPAVNLVLSWLAQGWPYAPSSPVAPEHALTLLRHLRRHGVMLRDLFWSDFVPSLQPGEPPARWQAVQREVVKLCEEDGACEAIEVPRLPPLLRARRFDVFEWVVEGFERGTTSCTEPPVEPLLNPFLASPVHRRQLHRLAARFEVVMKWLCSAPVLFSLVRKKEKRTLRWVLQRNPDALTSARDARGNTVLHELARVRGKTEGIAELLVDGGLDVLALNAAGHTASAVARQRGNDAFASLLEQRD